MWWGIALILAVLAGDTIVIGHETKNVQPGTLYRVAGIFFPEEPRCAREFFMMQQARSRLVEILDEAEFVEIEDIGEDEDGIPLLRLSIGEEDVADLMIADGFGSKGERNWCS